MKILAWTLFFFGVSWSAFAGTPISFVQLTDPHIFDDKVDNISGNKQVLRWCIDQINYRFDTEKSYNFVVMTGDLGLEGLTKKNIDGKKTLDDEQLNAAALELAGMIVRSKVKLWLFVPGNNDLLDEDPGTIDRYHFFIKALQTDTQSIMSVVDLCKPGGDSLSGPRDVGTCRFIGFDNSSFKSNGKESDARSFEGEQRDRIAQVLATLQNSDFQHAFIFYHIPEVNDPFFESPLFGSAERDNRVRTQESLENPNMPLSAWTVTHRVIEEWKKVVADPRVKGLFAGHFHTPLRYKYETAPQVGVPGTDAKIYICPPIARKRQEKECVQARGFRDVCIDGDSGDVKSDRIVWYEFAEMQVSQPTATQMRDPSEQTMSNSWNVIVVVGTLSALAAIVVGGAVGFLLGFRRTPPRPKVESDNPKIALKAFLDELMTLYYPWYEKAVTGNRRLYWPLYIVGTLSGVGTVFLAGMAKEQDFAGWGIVRTLLVLLPLLGTAVTSILLQSRLFERYQHRENGRRLIQELYNDGRVAYSGAEKPEDYQRTLSDLVRRLNIIEAEQAEGFFGSVRPKEQAKTVEDGSASTQK
jgi:hypothetical protein